MENVRPRFAILIRISGFYHIWCWQNFTLSSILTCTVFFLLILFLCLFSFLQLPYYLWRFLRFVIDFPFLDFFLSNFKDIFIRLSVLLLFLISTCTFTFSEFESLLIFKTIVSSAWLYSSNLTSSEFVNHHSLIVFLLIFTSLLASMFFSWYPEIFFPMFHRFHQSRYILKYRL